jgi:hypothetical protein
MLVPIQVSQIKLPEDTTGTGLASLSRAAASTDMGKQVTTIITTVNNVVNLRIIDPSFQSVI